MDFHWMIIMVTSNIDGPELVVTILVNSLNLSASYLKRVCNNFIEFHKFVYKAHPGAKQKYNKGTSDNGSWSEFAAAYHRGQ